MMEETRLLSLLHMGLGTTCWLFFFFFFRGPVYLLNGLVKNGLILWD